jgi:hypothetical protein
VQELASGRRHPPERGQTDLVLGHPGACSLDGAREALVRDCGGPPDLLAVVRRRGGDEVLPDAQAVVEGRVRDARREHVPVDGGHLTREDPDASLREAGPGGRVADRGAKLLREPGAARVRVRPDVLEPRHPAGLLEMPRLVDQENRVALGREEEERACSRKDMDVPGEVADRVRVHAGGAPDEDPVQAPGLQRGTGPLETALLLLERRLGRPAARLLRLVTRLEDRHGALRLKATSFISVISSIA